MFFDHGTRLTSPGDLADPGRELSASINRGILLQRFPRWQRLLAYLDRRFPVIGKLRVRDTYRGSSFLTSLRIDWTRR